MRQWLEEYSDSHRLQGLQFLLIGPAWLMADLYRHLGIKPVPSTPGRSTQ
jgi:hypothetical protein